MAIGGVTILLKIQGRGHILDLVLFLCPLKIMFSKLGTTQNFQFIGGGWQWECNVFEIFVFDI